MKKILSRFHAITENDYVLSFTGKGKCKYAGKKMISKNFFKKTVKCLGDSWGLSVYNAKNKTVNPARAEIFTKKYANENKIIDLPFLPPCESTLLLHVKRAN